MRFPFFKAYPGTNFHEIDLDYVLSESDAAYSLASELKTWASTHEAEYEVLADKVEGLINNLVDVISPWDSSIEYPIYSIVEYQGTNYIAVKPVPVGAMITNTEYWQPANTVIEQVNAIGVTVTELIKGLYYVTPEEFGAVGDGLHDDSEAIQSAVNDGRIIKLTEGKTYYIVSQIELAEGTTLDGCNATITCADVERESNNSAFHASEVGNITFKNVVFNGVIRAETPANLISIFKSYNVTFENCIFKNLFGYPIRVNDTSNIKVYRCRFENITGVTGNPGGGYYGRDNTGLRIEGCTASHLGDHMAYVTNTKDVIITGCNAEYTGENGLTAGSAIVIYGESEHVIVSNCIIANSRSGVSISPYADAAYSPANVLIDGVIVHDSILNAFTCDATAERPSENIAFANCKAVNAGQDAYNMRYCLHSSITACSSFSAHRYTCALSGTQDMKLADNTFSQDLAANLGLIILGQSAACANTSATGNLLIAGAGVGIYNRNSTGLIAESNRLVTTDTLPRPVLGGVSRNFGNGTFDTMRSITFETASESASRYHFKGDIIFNPEGTGPGTIGWLCTVAGTPGTLVAF